MMTQYDDVVERRAKEIKALEWGKQVKYILAQDGYMEIAYNDGAITREYRDGRKEVLEEGMSIDELLLNAVIPAEGD